MAKKTNIASFEQQLFKAADKLRKNIDAAEYKLTHQTKDGKGIYTFCMCPGGLVVPSASEEGMVVVNGMSEYERDKINANSALLVTVNETDFGSDHPLAGIKFQREIEKKAYVLGGSNYFAPIQTVGDFIKNTKTSGLTERVSQLPCSKSAFHLSVTFFCIAASASIPPTPHAKTDKPLIIVV